MAKRVVFRNVLALMLLVGMTRKEFADVLGISVGTLHNKLNGVTPFTLDEAIKIKQVLKSSKPIEEIFKRY